MDEVPLLLFLLILSGFFSGAEIALFGLGKQKIHALIKDPDITKEQLVKLERLQTLLRSPNKLLVTILVCNNIVNIGASSLSTVVAIDLANSSGLNISQSTLIGIVTGVMTFMILVFGEITPKALANKHALRFGLFIAPILNLLQIVLSPIVIPLAALTKKFMGDPNHISHGMTDEELKAVLEISEQEGTIQPEERSMVEKVLEFDTHSVETVMIPRSKIFSLPAETTLNEALQQVSESKFSRIPVYKDSEDNIIGILTTHHLIESTAQNIDKAKTIESLSLHKAQKVPPSMKIGALLSQFQEERTSHMALVYDEHGGLIGILTLEDILEEVFGEILDETDDPEYFIKRDGQFTFLCSGETELEQAEEFMKTELGEDSTDFYPWTLAEENFTIRHFLIEKFERFPEQGEKLILEAREYDFCFTIRRVNEQSIELIEITLIEKAPENE